MVRRMSFRLKHIETFKDRHGHTRVYYRRGKGKRIPLPALDSSAFMEAYNEANRDAPKSKRKAAGPGTIRALLIEYFGSADFRRNKLSSQTVTRRILERFAEEHGDRLVADIPRKAIQKIVGAKSATPGAANNLLKKLRALMAFAIDNDWRETDPTSGLKRFKEGTHHTWTDAELAQFEAKWLIGTRERTAYALALYTGQRRADLAGMKWSAYDRLTIVVAQLKGEMEAADESLTIPAHPLLREALDAWPRQHVRILATARANIMSPASFGNFVAGAIDAAGLPERCVLHGLRKAAARRLAEAGCTGHEIKAITGHKTLQQVEHYTKAADQKKMARSAIARLDGGK